MAITKELSTSIVSDLEILFDEKYYNAQLDVTAPNNAYEHFITVGQFKGISPHPFFDLKRYSILFNIPAEEALRHFFTVGINNNYSPHFLINLPYLKREILQHQELKEVLKNLRQEQNLSSTLALLSVFEKYGNQYQLSPSPYFDTTYYLRHLTIDIEETENAFCHFIKKGRHQTLDIVPEIDLEYYALKYKIESTDSVEILWELFCNFSHIRALNKHANLLHVFHRNLAKSFSLEDLITPASKSFMLAHGLLEETNELIEFHFLEINHTVFDDIKFQEVTFSDPIIYSGVGQLNLKGGTCKLPIPTLKRFNNCLVIGSETGLITQEKYINLESSLITKKDKYYVKHGGAIVEYVGKKDKIDKVAISYAKYLTLEIPEAILLCHTYCFNYFHFLIEVIPRLELIENEQNIPQEVPILIDRLPFKQLFEALECFTTRKLITVLPGQQVQVDKLHYPPQRSLIRDAVDVTTDLEEFIISPSALSYLRTKVLKRLKLEQQTRTFPTFGDKLFLQRKSKLGYRSATNIEEIEQLAESKGFSLVNPAEYSFLEQVAICSKAKVIMGTTGAHMTNCIFASAATVYILAGNTNPFLWSQLGDHLELTVKWVKGESIRKSAVPMPHDDYELPLAVVKELLETHL